jgi:hypothetical protein
MNELDVCSMTYLLTLSSPIDTPLYDSRLPVPLSIT